MNPVLYAFRFLYRIRYWLLIAPAAVAFVVFLKVRNISPQYEVKATIYTGVMSGYDIESSNSTRQDQQTVNNAMDNLINIITAPTTLSNVSLRLYAQHMVHGDPNRDNTYIQAGHFRRIDAKTPPEVRKLLDKKSDSITVANLRRYEKPLPSNFIYGLFNYTPRYYSYQDLSKITVKRLGNSDMLEIRYMTDDPGIAYNTLKLLNEEFIRQYEDLRFGETNNVIKYFAAELERQGRLLREAEDSLTEYNTEKKVINYDEQTKNVAALTRDYELRYEGILLDYNTSQRLIAELSNRVDEHTKSLKNNAEFVAKLNNIANLTAKIATIEPFMPDTTHTESGVLASLRRQLVAAENDFSGFAQRKSEQQYTKEGISSESVVSQWLDELIRNAKAKAELKVMKERKEVLDSQFTYFSPIGSTIKRKEREIEFTKQSYLSTLQSLNAARLRQKNLQMSSATLKIINPPTFPVESMPTKKKLVVAGGYFGTIVFLLGIFFLLELLDRTLRDKARAERLIGGKVLGALPGKMFRYRDYRKDYIDSSIQYLGNALLDYCQKEGVNVVNVMSIQQGEGKSFTAERLVEYYRRLGMNVGEEIVVVEYKALQETSVPSSLLKKASVNLLAVRADRVWKDTDQFIYDRLAERVGDAPLFICLTQAQRSVVEEFTGMLPPYTFFRKLGYRLCQFGLTSDGR